MQHTWPEHHIPLTLYEILRKSFSLDSSSGSAAGHLHAVGLDWNTENNSGTFLMGGEETFSL